VPVTVGVHDADDGVPHADANADLFDDAGGALRRSYDDATLSSSPARVGFVLPRRG